jgi:hypothetical protein
VSAIFSALNFLPLSERRKTKAEQACAKPLLTRIYFCSRCATTKQLILVHIHVRRRSNRTPEAGTLASQGEGAPAARNISSRRGEHWRSQGCERDDGGSVGKCKLTLHGDASVEVKITFFILFHRLRGCCTRTPCSESTSPPATSKCRSNSTIPSAK